jgi:uncharacterized membrane protein YjjP (DUF1212 family)
VTDPRETYKTLDFALRVGEMLLSNGAGVADVSATMGSITHHLGLRCAARTSTSATPRWYSGTSRAPTSRR